MPKKKRTRKPRKTLVKPTPELGTPADPDHLSKTDPLYTVILDAGSFIYVWDWVHRKNEILNRGNYFSPELRDVARRTAEVFSAASGIEPEEPRRKGKKKRKRCPATNKRGEQCRRSAGHPPPHKIKS